MARGDRIERVWIREKCPACGSLRTWEDVIVRPDGSRVGGMKGCLDCSLPKPV